MGDTTSKLPLQNVAVKDSLTYAVVPVEILHRRVQRFRNKQVASIKVSLRSLHKGDTWESEEHSKTNYPQLFPSDSILALNDSSSSVFQSCMRKFSLIIMLLMFLLASSVYLNVLGI